MVVYDILNLPSWATLEVSIEVDSGWLWVRESKKGCRVTYSVPSISLKRESSQLWFGAILHFTIVINIFVAYRRNTEFNKKSLTVKTVTICKIVEAGNFLCTMQFKRGQREDCVVSSVMKAFLMEGWSSYCLPWEDCDYSNYQNRGRGPGVEQLQPSLRGLWLLPPPENY